MAELVTLGIEIVSTPVDQATGKLQKFSNAARIAEESVQGIGRGTSAASKIAASALDGMTSRMKAVEKVSRDAEKTMAAQSLAAQKLAASSKVVASAANRNVQQVTKLHDVSNLAAQGGDIVTTAPRVDPNPHVLSNQVNRRQRRVYSDRQDHFAPPCIEMASATGWRKVDRVP